MNFDISLWALAILSIFFQLEAASTNKKCYKAKTCVHNNHEKCGIDGNGTPRRFLDSCDIFEYNCLKATDFKKAAMENCNHLKSLYAQQTLNEAGEENGNDQPVPDNGDDGGIEGDGDTATDNPNGDDGENEDDGDVATDNPNGDDGGNEGDGDVATENPNVDDGGNVGNVAAPEDSNGDDAETMGRDGGGREVKTLELGTHGDQSRMKKKMKM